MDIRYWDPLGRGLEGMKEILMRPVDLGKWFALGFTAWLANLINGWGGGGSGASWRGNLDSDELQGVVTGTTDRVEDLLSSSIEFAFVGVALFVALGLVVLFLWLSSRGQFVYLDNVVHNRSRVTEPWNRLAGLADSLFRWRLLFAVAIFLAFGMLAATAALLAITLGFDGWGRGFSILGYMILGSVTLMATIVVAYVQFFLSHFVVPLMYKHDESATAAWQRFLGQLTAQPWPFVLVGLFFLLITLIVGAVITVLGLATCCVGFIVLGMPYLGAVLLLPVTTTLRLFDLQWLAQFGPDFDALATTSPVTQD